jgi:sulfate transport system substrate-binding protein
VDKNVDKHGTRAAAEKYLQFLFSDEAQELAARHHYRTVSAAVSARHAGEFTATPARLVRVADLGGWALAQKTHFDDGGWFDQLYAAR